jgi:hypothetical protein
VENQRRTKEEEEVGTGGRTIFMRIFLLQYLLPFQQETDSLYTPGARATHLNTSNPFWHTQLDIRLPYSTASFPAHLVLNNSHASPWRHTLLHAGTQCYDILPFLRSCLTPSRCMWEMLLQWFQIFPSCQRFWRCSPFDQSLWNITDSFDSHSAFQYLFRHLIL